MKDQTKKMSTPTTIQEWGVRYEMFTRSGQLVTRQSLFPSEDRRDRFIEKLVDRDDFNVILSYSDPREVDYPGLHKAAGVEIDERES